MQKYTLS